MENSHKVRFNNLIDVKTGEPVELEVPNNLVYEGSMLAARTFATQEARRVLACLRSPNPDALF